MSDYVFCPYKKIASITIRISGKLKVKIAYNFKFKDQN
jgi:hypothetical protein